MLTPREQTIYRNRLNYYRRIDKETAVERTVEWYEAWYFELVGHKPPQEYKKEVTAFLIELQRKLDEKP